MQMKKLLVLCISAALLIALFSACSPAVRQHFKEETETQKPMNLLIIGNSHSIDAFHFLYDVFQEQQPDREIVLGVLHYGGCSISSHLQFAQHHKAVYTYFRNTNGQWEICEKVDMVSVLEDQPWNMVMFQAAKTDLDETLNETGRRELEAFVAEHISAAPEYLWHTSWPSPNDEAFFSEDSLCPAPEGYRENLMNLYGFNPVNQFTVLTDMAKTHILPDAHYTKAVCSGAAVMYAHLALGIPQTALWRDYTHLSDYGRLMVAYAMYTQLTGNPINAIHRDAIPAAQRYFLFQELGDLEITKQMAGDIIQAANYALQDPWRVPE